MELVFNAKRISSLRRALKVKQATVASVLGISRQTYIKKEQSGRFWLHEAEALTELLTNESIRQGLEIERLP